MDKRINEYVSGIARQERRYKAASPDLYGIMCINLIDIPAELANASADYKARIHIVWPLLNRVGRNYLTMKAEENAAQIGQMLKRMRGDNG